VREMATKLISKRVKQTSYLSGYLILLVYTLTGFMFKGEVWLLLGAFCWIAIVSRHIVSYIFLYNKKRSLETLLKTEHLKNEKENSDQKRDKSNPSFGFAYW
jgi:membrane protein implicated in regulation of membrane protease activity